MSNPIFEASVAATAPRAPQVVIPARRHPLISGASVEIYGAEIPRKILAAAEASADNPYSCLAVCRAFEPEIAAVLRHAVVYSGARVLGILSYYEKASSLVVVNRLIGLDAGILDDCVRALFVAHPTARRVVIDGVYAAEARRQIRVGLPRRSWSAIENLFTALPSSFEQYMSHFGSKTRKNLRYCAKRFERENPRARFEVLTRDEIDKTTVDALIELNHLRMESKGRVSGMDTRFATGLLALCRSHGIAFVARAEDGTVLGGTLCTHVGTGFALQVIAHDPKFNHVRLGLLCLLKSIETAIASGASVFHFLWGSSDYKVLFGARAAPLVSYRYYRHWPHYLLAMRDWRDQVLQATKRHARRLRAGFKRKAGHRVNESEVRA